MKILIKNGRLIDPAQRIDAKLNLLTANGIVASITQDEPEADFVIDAFGDIVCPGFIDLHAHEDPVENGTIYCDEGRANLACLLRMGVTTCLCGNCGDNFCNPSQFLDMYQNGGCFVNVAMLAGYTYFREKYSSADRYSPVTKQEINERIAALIEQSIQSTGVINLFETKREFSLFDEGFMEELRKMKEKNLAVQLLEKLVKERIRQYERTNIVQSQKFSELMNQALSNYLKGMLTNEEVIEELLKMAAEIKKTEEEGNELGLNVEEKAFYDALTSPEGIRDAYSNDEFIALTKELTEQLRKNRTIDWNKKESARAKMRVLVKRLLKKYKYPPEGQEQALNTVMAQCNKWADDEDNLLPSTSEPNVERKVVGRKKAVEIQLKPIGSVLDDVEKDDEVRRLVHNMMELYEGTTIMNIVLECQREFQEKYFNMKGNDWRHLIRDYVRMVTERPELQETEVFRYVMAG